MRIQKYVYVIFCFYTLPTRQSNTPLVDHFHRVISEWRINGGSWIGTRGRDIPQQCSNTFRQKQQSLASNLGISWKNNWSCCAFVVLSTIPFNCLKGPKSSSATLENCNLIHKGYHIVCVNYFCSFDLARKLPTTLSIWGLDKIVFYKNNIFKVLWPDKVHLGSRGSGA